jgi:choline dehydrogenase-like flavoprotein
MLIMLCTRSCAAQLASTTGGILLMLSAASLAQTTVPVQAPGLECNGTRILDPFKGKLAVPVLPPEVLASAIASAVEQSPDPKNQVTLSSATDALGLPRPRITYNLSDYTKQGIAAAFRLKKLIFKKLGAEDFTKTADGDPVGFDQQIEGETVRLTYGGAGHVMGTYRMGNDPKTSVVDSFQRSHDHPNLYLVGSGTFPTVGTANPTLTQSALALRTAERIAALEFK